jgi:hypothetical protein
VTQPPTPQLSPETASSRREGAPKTPAATVQATARTSNISSRPGPRARALIVAGLLGFGLFLLAAAFPVVDVQPSRGVPYWIVGSTGVIALLGGVAVLLPPRASAGSDVVGALLFSAFAGLALWVGFGPGERHFNGGVLFGGIGWSGAANVSLGRIMFGLGGVLIGWVALYCWWRALRRLSGPRDDLS